MAITDWPTTERPREKLLSQGVQTLSDAELLAIFLRTGRKGKTAVDLARDLLNKFGNLRSILEIDYDHFSQEPGLGKAKYAQLQAILEMARRHLLTTLSKQDVLTNPEATARYLISKLRNHQQEVFACLFLDNRHYVIQFEELFYGTLTHANIYPREVVKRALAHNAAAIIFAHNHPSGIADPSEADIDITKVLIKALDLVEIRVLDHLIIGEGKATSLAECGFI